MNNMDFNQQDVLEEEGDVVDRIYDINDKYKAELNSANPDQNKLLKLMNQQLMEGLKLQLYSNNIY